MRAGLVTLFLVTLLLVVRGFNRRAPNAPPRLPWARSRSSDALPISYTNDTVSPLDSLDAYLLSTTLRRWKSFSEGRSGLLVILVPAVLTQAFILQRILPFFVDRLVQYLNPTLIAISMLLQSPKTLDIVQSGIWSVISIGGAYMLYDTFKTGSSWSPLPPPERETFALITGASSGLGREMARRLYLYGYSVILVARDLSQLDETKKLLVNSLALTDQSSRRDDAPRRTRDIVLISSDLSEQGSTDQIMEILRGKGIANNIEVLVNNAGVCSRRSHFASGSLETSLHVVDLNVQGAISLTRRLLPQMIERRRGRVVFVSSVTSMTPTPRQAVYAASKAFINSFALVLNF